MGAFGGKHVLVVGGAGFVGSRLVRRLLADEPRRVLVIDNLLSSERENLPASPAITFVEGSIADDRVLGGITDDLDYVFHLATYHGNQSSIADPLADHEHNTLTSLKLFLHLSGHLSRSRRLAKVVYASAGCSVAEKTFDEVEATPEDAPVSLFFDSPYQVSKIIGELYGNYFFLHDGLPVVKARFQNVYGPGEVLGAGLWRGTPATVWRNVVPTFVYRALKRLPLIVENDGRSSRDFIYIDDIVEGLLRCAERGRPGEVYNLASGVETSIRDLAARVNALCESPTPIEWGPRRDWDRSGRRYGSTVKARAALDFAAAVGLEEGLARTVAWSREHLAFIDACVAKHAHRLG